MSNPGQNATLEELNRKEDQILGQLQRHLPRTYQLLAGIRFEVPPQRAADYVHYGYAVYENARMLLETAAEREDRADSLETWTAVAGSCGVLNEWLKRGQTTLFVERELGEALKRTDLPGGVLPERLALAMDRLSLGPSVRLVSCAGGWNPMGRFYRHSR